MFIIGAQQIDEDKNTRVNQVNCWITGEQQNLQCNRHKSTHPVSIQVQREMCGGAIEYELVDKMIAIAHTNCLFVTARK